MRGKIAKDYAETLLGRDRKALCKAAGVYVRSLRTTWQVVYNNWDALGADPVGDSPVVTVLRTKVAPKMGVRSLRRHWMQPLAVLAWCLGFATIMTT